MPVGPCTEGGRPGYRCGESGRCYTYAPGDDAGRRRAKQRAVEQCIAMDEDPGTDASPTTPAYVPARELNRLLEAGRRRGDELEARLAALLEPVLERAGLEAARRFGRLAVDHLRAAGDAALVASMGPADRRDLRGELALSAAAPPTGTMIALYPRPEEAAALAVEGEEPPEALHVTLAFLGDGVGEDELRAVREALEPVAASHAPLAGEVGGAGRFADKGDGQPAILLPDVPGLVELRVAACEALARAGIGYARDHGFTAHITLAYVGEGERPPGGEPPLEAPLHFDAIHVVRADSRSEPLPLSGRPPLTADAAWSSPAADELVDVERLVAELRGRTDPVRRAAIEAMMDSSLRAAGLDFDPLNVHARRVLEQSASQVTNIAETTRTNVRRIVQASYRDGLSIRDTAAAIRAGMRSASPARARLIARTEMVGAANGGSVAAARIVGQAAGVAYWKQWLTAGGAPHPRHELYPGLDGQTVALDATFVVGDADLAYPGDPAGPPEEVCNCRCAVGYTEEPPEGEAAVPQAAGEALVEAPPLAEGSLWDAPVAPDVERRIHELGLDGWPPRKSALARRLLGDATDTEALYGKAAGWAARRELHTRIVTEFFRAKTAAAEEPTAFFTSGGAASGKGATRFRVGGRDLGLDDLRLREDTIVIDADEIKKLLPEYRALVSEGDAYASWAVHEESAYLAKQVLAHAIQRRQHAVIDGVGGGDPGYFLAKLAAMRDHGYRVQVSMSSAPVNRALERMVARGDRTGRYVATRPLRNGHATSSRAHLEWRDADFVDRWTVWDTTSRPPRLVAEGGRGGVRVLDPEAYGRILGKAGELAPRPAAVEAVGARSLGTRPWVHLKDTTLDSHIRHRRLDVARAEEVDEARAARLRLELEELEREREIRRGALEEPRPWQHLKDTTLDSHIRHARLDIERSPSEAQAGPLRQRLAELAREKEIRTGGPVVVEPGRRPPSQRAAKAPRRAPAGRPRQFVPEVPAPPFVLLRAAAEGQLPEGVLYRARSGYTKTMSEAGEVRTYRAGFGWVANVRGYPVFIEDSLHDPQAIARMLGEKLDVLARSSPGAWERLPEGLKTIEVFGGGRSPIDDLMGARYGISDYEAAATASQYGDITFWRGGTSGLAAGRDGTLYHEIGHRVGVRNGPPNEKLWRAAMRADAAPWRRTTRYGDYYEDAATGREAQVAASYESHQHTIFRAQGISSYGETKIYEDWAETLRLYLQDRAGTTRLGQIRDSPDGIWRVARFEDFWPERARALELWFSGRTVARPARRRGT